MYGCVTMSTRLIVAIISLYIHIYYQIIMLHIWNCYTSIIYQFFKTDHLKIKYIWPLYTVEKKCLKKKACELVRKLQITQ